MALTKAESQSAEHKRGQLRTIWPYHHRLTHHLFRIDQFSQQFQGLAPAIGEHLLECLINFHNEEARRVDDAIESPISLAQCPR
ncbi:MAG: hypothetical protein CMI15_05275 [Opitutaceae bacterium]|nr:hypothetical protein [Opitutaceae bacterium]